MREISDKIFEIDPVICDNQSLIFPADKVTLSDTLPNKWLNQHYNALILTNTKYTNQDQLMHIYNETEDIHKAKVQNCLQDRFWALDAQ